MSDSDGFVDMNSALHKNNLEISDKFASLKKSVDLERKSNLKKRLAKQPQATDQEFLLGAFIEMYEPHLMDLVHDLTKKGYALDPSSGFGGKFCEFQVLSGNFALDFITRNKLEKKGIKFREYNDFHSLVFWPEKASLEHIKQLCEQVVALLPDKNELSTPSMSNKAVEFRRKYLPQQINLQKMRLFEKLKYGVQKKNEIELKKRISKKIVPNKDELILGLFTEELEPQVKNAVLVMHKKGYSTDMSGFSDPACDQMIEGDFQLAEETVAKLMLLGVFVETNPSGYTRIRFTADQANISKIKKKWDKVVALLPDTHSKPFPSMTKKARDFRNAYRS